MKHFTLSILVFSLLVLTLSGCKKNDINDPEGNEYIIPKVATQELMKLPDNVENNEYFGTIGGLITSYRGLFSTYNAYFANIPEGAIHATDKSTIDSWTWTNGGINIKVSYSDNGTYNHWELFINNALYAESNEYNEINKGENLLYDASSLKIDYKYEQSGNYINSTYLLLGEKTIFMKTRESIENSEGSLDAYEGTNDGGNQFYHIQWTTTGSCSGWIKDLDTGKTFSF
jgi:hypothetical protein